MDTTGCPASLKQNASALASQNASLGYEKGSRSLGDDKKTYYGMEDNSPSSCGLKMKLS